MRAITISCRFVLACCAQYAIRCVSVATVAWFASAGRLRRARRRRGRVRGAVGAYQIPGTRRKLARRACLTQSRGRCAYVYGAAVPLLTDTLRGGSTRHGTRRRIYRLNFRAILTDCSPLPVRIFSCNAIDARYRSDWGELAGDAELAAGIDDSSIASIAPTHGRSRVGRARKGHAAVAYSRGSACLSIGACWLRV